MGGEEIIGLRQCTHMAIQFFLKMIQLFSSAPSSLHFMPLDIQTIQKELPPNASKLYPSTINTLIRRVSCWNRPQNICKSDSRFISFDVDTGGKDSPTHVYPWFNHQWHCTSLTLTLQSGMFLQITTCSQFFIHKPYLLLQHIIYENALIFYHSLSLSSLPRQGLSLWADEISRSCWNQKRDYNACNTLSQIKCVLFAHRAILLLRLSVSSTDCNKLPIKCTRVVGRERRGGGEPLSERQEQIIKMFDLFIQPPK